jgi:hypothetical protein
VTSGAQALRTAQQDAGFLSERALRVAFVACSYDTDFEPVESQVAAKCDQIARSFPAGGPVSWVLWVVDDDANHPDFGAAARRASVADGVQIRTLSLAHRPAGGAKGRAILAGFRTALEEDPALDALVYINLNLKVDAQLAATGIRRIVEGADAAIGTRSSSRGGRVVGAGRLGRVKSIAFNRLVTGLLPQLRGWRDTNAPMKVFAPSAARLLFENAVIPRVTLDVEWLTLLRAAQARVEPFGVVWTQRPGSSPPWHLVLRAAADVVIIRRRWGVPADLA